MVVHLIQIPLLLTPQLQIPPLFTTPHSPKKWVLPVFQLVSQLRDSSIQQMRDAGAVLLNKYKRAQDGHLFLNDTRSS